jgi:pyochelin biosynthesis protein PchC
MPSSTHDWLRIYHPRPDARVRLVCLPPAGASAPFFRSWVRFLPPEFELISVQYPGRLDRMRDPAISSMDSMADAVTEALLPHVDQSLALFGHSMGSALAFEVAKRLSRDPRSRLVRLFLSGYPAPARRRPTAFHRSPDSVLIAELNRLGTIDETLCEDPDLLATLLHPLRSDYQIVETYRPTAESPLAAPITAIVGDDDEETPEDAVRAWQELTDGDFRVERFPGGHFYLNEWPADVVGLVASQLSEKDAVACKEGLE